MTFDEFYEKIKEAGFLLGNGVMMARSRQERESTGLQQKSIRISGLDARTLGAAKLATRLAFFIGGFGIACWASMEPFAAQCL